MASNTFIGSAPDSAVLFRPIDTLKGIGPGIAAKLAKLGLYTIQDVLFHLPLRYQDRTRVYPIGTLTLGQEVVVVGEVDHCEVVFRKRRMLLVRISDGTGALLLRFFHFSAAQQKQFASGQRISCFGEIRSGGACYEIVHPEYRFLAGEQVLELSDRLTPIYPATEGVQQPTLRKLTEAALAFLPLISDPLPEALRLHFRLPSLQQALLHLHKPEHITPGFSPLRDDSAERRRLALEELLSHQLVMLKMRAETRKERSVPLRGKGQLAEEFLKQLPFSLTNAQRRIVDEVALDLGRSEPMLRLVQGDVGSGKTVVAAMACLQAVDAGFQAALMAPTEILAEQHFQNFRRWLAPLDLKVAWLSGKQRVAARREMRALIASGEAAVIVGTHALFQADVEFHSLALVVIDEQHRFGVHQRMALRDKGAGGSTLPHQLIMTATPIPRTLAMTAYADLDLSVIDELPPGRTPVKTVVMNNERRDELIAHVGDACREGRQCYWVCTLIEESEMLQAQAAEDTLMTLSDAIPDLRVGLVHGRMKPAEKEAVMASFKAADLDLLVATTVIEVGVDVPNASLMVIENAERLGLSQLHQLRGRVGRGAKASTCVLLYQLPLGETSKKRLNTMRETNDGFRIAEIDLELRGPGELLGVKQTGALAFRVADIERDEALLEPVQMWAERLWAEAPNEAAEMIRRWVGEKQQYRQV